MKLVLLLLAPLVLSAEYNVTAVYSTAGKLTSETIPLTRLMADGQYSLLFSVSPAALGADGSIVVELMDNGRALVAKTLHAGDADLYAPFHLGKDARAVLKLSASGVTGNYKLQINAWPVSTQRKTGGNHSVKDASPMVLGQTVFA
jgi:hypothetical protein